MIHHVSIPARNPEHVARVLHELIGGYVGPFVGPFPGSWVAYAEDAFGTGFEVYPDGTALMPGQGDEQCSFQMRDSTSATTFHALVSVKADRATIERIGAREGWRTRNFWRGPNAETRLFELYEFWIENRIMLELATEDMLPNYVKLTNARAQKAMFERLPKRG